MSEGVLQAILPYLTKPKIQTDGRIRAWCIFHDDGHGKPPHEPDLYVDAKGYKCYARGAHGSLRDLAKKLGVEYTEPARRHTAFEELLGRGIKEETLLHFGVREGESGDLFIPIRDEADAEIATRIRAASGKKLWPRREVDPRRADILTDWERIRTAKTAVLVAGETDFLVTWQAGYPAATFLHGEGTVKPEAVKKLVSVVNAVDVLYDADHQGVEGAAKVRREFEAKGLKVRVKNVPTPNSNCKDICDLYRSLNFDDERLREALNTAKEIERPNTKTSAGLHLTELAALLLEPEEKVAYVWEDTLPAGGLSIVAAKPKVGKTTLAQNLALKVARGEPFLGRSTNQGSVIYLAFEEKRGEVARHFRMMGASEEPVFVHTGMAPEEALDALHTAIQAKDAVLAVVDPLFRFLRIRDANDYAEVSRELEPLLNLSRETSCHIMVVHHAGKLERGGGDSILGSTALFGGVDTAIILTRHEAGRVIETIQRYGEDLPKTLLEFEAITGVLSSSGTVEEADIKRRETKILEDLGDSEMTEKDIRDAIGGNTGLTGKALRSLCVDEKVVREGSGKKGDPYVYRQILVSSFPNIEKQENENRQESLVGLSANKEWGEI